MDEKEELTCGELLAIAAAHPDEAVKTAAIKAITRPLAINAIEKYCERGQYGKLLEIAANGRLPESIRKAAEESIEPALSNLIQGGSQCWCDKGCQNAVLDMIEDLRLPEPLRKITEQNLVSKILELIENGRVSGGDEGKPLFRIAREKRLPEDVREAAGLWELKELIEKIDRTESARYREDMLPGIHGRLERMANDASLPEKVAMRAKEAIELVAMKMIEEKDGEALGYLKYKMTEQQLSEDIATAACLKIIKKAEAKNSFYNLSDLVELKEYAPQTLQKAIDMKIETFARKYIYEIDSGKLLREVAEINQLPDNLRKLATERANEVEAVHLAKRLQLEVSGEILKTIPASLRNNAATAVLPSKQKDAGKLKK